MDARTTRAMEAKGKKLRSAVLVDLGGDWLKLLFVEFGPQAPGVTRLHLQKVDPVIGPSAGEVASAVKGLKAEGVPVVLCLPRQSVNLRLLELPSTDAVELADMVELQAGKQTPYSREEIVYDYRIFPSDRSGYSRAMLAIVQKNALRSRHQVLEEAGLHTHVTTVSTEGLLNWGSGLAVHGDGKGVVALLDVDSYYSEFVVLSSRGLLFSRTVMIGANEVAGAGDAALPRLADEVKHSLEMSQSEVRGQTPSRLVLCGAASRIEGIADRVARVVGVPCETQAAAASLRKPPTGPSMADSEFSAVSIDALVGIALAPHLLDLDLVSEIATLKREMIEKSRALTAMGACTMAALVCASMYGLTKLRLEKQQLALLKDELARIEPAVHRIEQRQEIVAVVQERGDLQGAPVNVLLDLTGLIPKDIFPNSIKFDSEKNTIILEGTGPDTKAIRTLVESIEGSPRFSGARESNARLDSASGKWRFQIAFAVEKPR
jgi:hypothetical protein